MCVLVYFRFGYRKPLQWIHFSPSKYDYYNTVGHSSIHTKPNFRITQYYYKSFKASAFDSNGLFYYQLYYFMFSIRNNFWLQKFRKLWHSQKAKTSALNGHAMEKLFAIFLSNNEEKEGTNYWIKPKLRNQ